ncbi:hypothetical protein FFLO_01782 [Filobasidium floriforme]|uniref:DNA-directed RNA polymerase II subunit RPB9 n=1 Tax=Filobasidium floriforme TaxID=5210 RepID=A0A8K0JQ58_9TREE|nr:hypothetical protein FFLO_01782 [Filobasidium floriforme]
MPIKFCGDCSSLLYPKAGTDRRLHYVCKQCPFTMFTVNKEDNQIRRDELLSVVREKRGVTQDVELDPTLMRSRKQCPICHAESAVQFQDQSNEVMRKSTSMILFYKCLACKADFDDEESKESAKKDEQRLAREERIAAKNKKGGKPDAKPEGNAREQVLAARPTPAQGPPASIAQSGTGNMDVIDAVDSDDDDY